MRQRSAALSWLPDSSGVVYSSSAGSTVPYPSTFNLRRVGRDGSDDRSLTFGDLSYVQPDVHSSGRVLTSRIRGQSDIWKFPVGGSPDENTRNAVRVTRQSGQVQTPSVSPDGTEVVYLSDNGGHGNLWVTKADGTGVARQITFERDPATTIGVPIWSPSDNRIAFVVSRDRISIWTVNSDGRNPRELIGRGLAPCWSPDGEWMYYSPLDNNEQWRIEKVPAPGAGHRRRAERHRTCTHRGRTVRALLRDPRAADGRSLGLGIPSRQSGGRAVGVLTLVTGTSIPVSVSSLPACPVARWAAAGSRV